MRRFKSQHVFPDSDDSHCGEFASAEQSFSSAVSEAVTEADDLVTASTSLENVEVRVSLFDKIP